MRKAKNENQNSKKVYPILLLANPQDSIFSNEKISKKRRGSFTLIELLVTSSIIMIMLAVTIAYSQRGEGINKVNRMIERLTFDIRRVANLSTQTQEIGDKKICGWGIYFDDQYNDRYVVFSDFCEEGKIYGNKQFDKNQNELYEEIKLTPKVIIEAYDFSWLLYLPPEPRIEIYDEFEDIVGSGNVTLKFAPGTFTRTLNINQLGMITSR